MEKIRELGFIDVDDNVNINKFIEWYKNNKDTTFEEFDDYINFVKSILYVANNEGLMELVNRGIIIYKICNGDCSNVKMEKNNHIDHHIIVSKIPGERNFTLKMYLELEKIYKFKRYYYVNAYSCIYREEQIYIYYPTEELANYLIENENYSTFPFTDYTVDTVCLATKKYRKHYNTKYKNHPKVIKTLLENNMDYKIDISIKDIINISDDGLIVAKINY